MKLRILIPSIIVALLTFGCAKQDTAKAVVAAPAQPGVRVIELTGNDAMKYNMNSIELNVGEEVKVIFTNIGTMPKQAMAHNFVVLKAGSDAAAFSMAAAPAAATNYIPPALQDEVIAHTKMLGPKESDTVTLKFAEAGQYPFLCSFPAHFQVGMKGVITVK
ncbi:MAG: cupredoxin domain-containing protein [Cephaloticoccus sp.]|nr:cupredoxin domain-containing protein [Cephaloticoccus sp.]MCF7759159.1 cupredoxin domain-containing protein [Cephaloticoccus sp.]